MLKGRFHKIQIKVIPIKRPPTDEELLANIELPSPSPRSAVSAPGRVGTFPVDFGQKSSSVSSRVSSSSRESGVLLKDTSQYEKILAELQAVRAPKPGSKASTIKTSEVILWL